MVYGLGLWVVAILVLRISSMCGVIDCNSFADITRLRERPDQRLGTCLPLVGT